MVNDAFMKVFEHIDRYDSERPFKAWFRRILVNTALDHYRAARRYHTHMLTDQDVPETEYQATQELQLNAEDIIRLFDQLPPMQRLVFNLFEVEGYSHDEIGGLLDISPGTSRSNLTRARQRLQYLYINQFGGRS
ncbi:MAG: ECF-type RNA polymerase sigma 70 factor [Bacteroidetes bacterium HLUCCA01]|nr:MAG: ECF-type RNA polymerase sigma 70 factor [Bacteroidetes bacterium HLUCCA01]